MSTIRRKPLTPSAMTVLAEALGIAAKARLRPPPPPPPGPTSEEIEEERLRSAERIAKAEAKRKMRAAKRMSIKLFEILYGVELQVVAAASRKDAVEFYLAENAELSEPPTTEADIKVEEVTQEQLQRLDFRCEDEGEHETITYGDGLKTALAKGCRPPFTLCATWV